MNAAPQNQPETSAAVDASNPWLGLSSFTEETRSYFYGREEEVAELARRVQRRLLTVLFGQSGLGKTSILRAGLVPRLRDQGYCPVYVRIDYGRDAPEPAEQIKQAIRQSAGQSGQWSQAGVAVEGESLWEFLHHRDDVLRDAFGTNLIPLLIFDQFEEIFTLAQTDEFGRTRAAHFIEDLADLVENRPPKVLEARLDADDSTAESFDFARSDYRVLISLREDYLAPLESLKSTMPSISQNRLRLAPMTGTQALAAVLQPGGKLVSEEVAAAIVRFVAGGGELANAEVEPALLSLICRELNDARIAAGRREISLDLLAGSHASILSNFYERSLADQPASVRRVIEDDLLTASGFRENVAEERLTSRLTAAGAAPGTLALLVNRRLLRVEERLDIRRVELTHDVLCGVVKASRDQRQEREAREAAERLLADQQQRELAARKALMRARQIAIGCTLLAVVAVIAAVFAYFSLQRAKLAERDAQETRAVTEQARVQAEQLLGYLSDDFARELESSGRLAVAAEFAQRQIDYFHGLPPRLKGPETTRNGALALIHHARALRFLGDTPRAKSDAAEAIDLLDKRIAAGDRSQATILALGLADNVQAQIFDNLSDPTGPLFEKKAIELLRPLAEAPGAGVSERRAYAEALVRRTFEQANSNLNKEAIATAADVRKLTADMGALDLSDPEISSLYAEAGAWLTTSLTAINRNEEAIKVATGDAALAEKVLEGRPGNRLALHAAQVLYSNIVSGEMNLLNPPAAVANLDRMIRTSDILLGMDPNNVTSQNNMGVGHELLGDALWYQGKLREAIPAYAISLGDYGRALHGGATFFVVYASDLSTTAIRQAQTGDPTGAEALLMRATPSFEAQHVTAADPFAPAAVKVLVQIARARIAEIRGDPAAELREAEAGRADMEALKLNGDFEEQSGALGKAYTDHAAGRAQYILGDFAAAEQHERRAVEERSRWGTEGLADQRDLAEMVTWLAMAMARQGHATDAANTIRPIVKREREFAARNRGDGWIPFELAAALYTQSLAEPTNAAALRAEATRLVDALAPQIRSSYPARQLREFLRH